MRNCWLLWVRVAVMTAFALVFLLAMFGVEYFVGGRNTREAAAFAAAVVGGYAAGGALYGGLAAWLPGRKRGSLSRIGATTEGTMYLTSGISMLVLWTVLGLDTAPGVDGWLNHALLSLLAYPAIIPLLMEAQLLRGDSIPGARVSPLGIGRALLLIPAGATGMLAGVTARLTGWSPAGVAGAVVALAVGALAVFTLTSSFARDRVGPARVP